jgi:hypothetical protein
MVFVDITGYQSFAPTMFTFYSSNESHLENPSYEHAEPTFGGRAESKHDFQNAVTLQRVRLLWTLFSVIFYLRAG